MTTQSESTNTNKSNEVTETIYIVRDPSTQSINNIIDLATTFLIITGLKIQEKETITQEKETIIQENENKTILENETIIQEPPKTLRSRWLSCMWR